MLEQPLENNKHPNFEWRGQGRGVDSYVMSQQFCRRLYLTDDTLSQLGNHGSLSY